MGYTTVQIRHTNLEARVHSRAVSPGADSQGAPLSGNQHRGGGNPAVLCFGLGPLLSLEDITYSTSYHGHLATDCDFGFNVKNLRARPSHVRAKKTPMPALTLPFFIETPSSVSLDRGGASLTWPSLEGSGGRQAASRSAS